MRERFVSTAVVLAYLTRTLERGVPMRVALMRAERRYGVNRDVIRAFLRSGQ
jgi:hypothetical protein